MKHDLSRIASLMASDFVTAAGAIPLERLVRMHAAAFETFRAAGLTWEQISRLLGHAGISRPDGRSFSPAHLRGVFGRQVRQRTKSPLGAALLAIEPAIRPADQLAERTQRRPTASAAIVGDVNAVSALRKRADGSHRSRDDRGTPALESPRTPETAPTLPSRAKVLQLMRQSSDARRSGR